MPSIPEDGTQVAEQLADGERLGHIGRDFPGEGVEEGEEANPLASVAEQARDAVRDRAAERPTQQVVRTAVAGSLESRVNSARRIPPPTRDCRFGLGTPVIAARRSVGRRGSGGPVAGTEATCPSRGGCRTAAHRGRRCGSAGRRPAARLRVPRSGVGSDGPLSIASASAATVRPWRSCRDVKSKPAARARDTNWIASRLSPPIARNESKMLTRSRPRMSANIAASCSSSGVRGATYVAVVSSKSGSGRRLRSSFPTGVSGNSSSTMIADGTICAGRRSDAASLRDGGVGVVARHVRDECRGTGRSLVTDGDGEIDCWVVGQDRVDLAEFDAQAADLDLEVGAAHIVQFEVRGEPHKVTGSVDPRSRWSVRVGDEPTRRQVWSVVVTPSERVTRQVELAENSRRYRLKGAIENQHMRAADRSADRHRFVRVNRGASRPDRELRGAVEIEQLDPPRPTSPPGRDLRPHRPRTVRAGTSPSRNR